MLGKVQSSGLLVRKNNTFGFLKKELQMNRSRFLYFLFFLATVSSGLASRHYSGILPDWVNSYLGDTLWALMVFILLAILFPKKSSVWIALLALLFSFSIEFSQLYHAYWIDNIRHTAIGGLVLGFGFLWSDLICYTLGIAFGYLTEILRTKWMRSKE
ncbi:MAG: DUF2809 domain-containing protein [Bacteroidales bacterium]|nr:DUF2809 domain-containing protein [Bacteroidales bacterium]